MDEVEERPRTSDPQPQEDYVDASVRRVKAAAIIVCTPAFLHAMQALAKLG